MTDRELDHDRRKAEQERAAAMPFGHRDDAYAGMIPSHPLGWVASLGFLLIIGAIRSLLP